MKNGSIRAVALTITLGLVLWALSCGGGEENNNVNINRNQNVNANTAMKFDYDSDCDSGDLDNKMSKIQAKIDQALKKDDELNGHVTFQLYKVNDAYLEANVEGLAGGEDELEDLAKIFRPFMNPKKHCLMKVIFVPEQKAADNTKPNNDGFVWTACEWPLQACPNGECANVCPVKPPDTANTNANTRPGSNSNSNSNTGPSSNSNRSNGAP